jgi:hypothetical protein
MMMTAPDQLLTATLEAQQWNAVMSALHEAPYRMAAPIIEALSRQLQAAAAQTESVTHASH